jgi:hypothetical protein
MSKPDLTPLTGGYRRIPVLQIGADICCESQMAIADLEKAPGISNGMAAAIPGHFQSMC